MIKSEHRALAGAVLSHECYLRAPAHRKRGLIENGLFAVFERHIIESEDYFVVWHNKNARDARCENSIILF